MNSNARLGPYEIKGFLTDVGLDDLYRGTDTRRDEDILLRPLSVFLHEEDTIERLRARARRIATIDHPHLLPLSSVEKSDGPVLAVAGYTSGRALDHFVPDGGLSRGDVLSLSAQLAGALAALHREHLVHGYLHAGRVIVSDEGRITLLVIGPEEATANPAPRVAACRAPELWDGAEIDAHTDVFALGALLHHLAVGRPPFPGATTAVIQEAIRWDRTPRVTERRPDLPNEFARIVRRCLEKDRAWRYEDADAIHGDVVALQSVLADSTEPTRAATPRTGFEVSEVPGHTLRDARPEPGEPGLRPHIAPTPEPEPYPKADPLPQPHDPEPAHAEDDEPASRIGEIDEDDAATLQDDADDGDEPAAEELEAEGPEAERPATEEPEAEEPEAERPASEEPGAEEPEAAVPHRSTPERSTPGISAPDRRHRDPAGVARPAATGGHVDWRRDWRLAVAGATVLVTGLIIGWLVGGVGGGSEETAPAASLERATWAAGPELFPQLSPDGTWLYFARARDGDWGIYAQRVGEDEAIELTAGSPFGDSQPALSADGARLAFRSERDGGGIFLMGTQGSSVRRLSDFGHNPAWSPDGGQVAIATAPVYDTAYPGATGEIVAVDTSTGERRVIVEGGMQPHWSPDGEHVAYWSSRGRNGTDIWTVPAAGGEPVAVTDDNATDWNPVWSPAGDELYFVSNRGGNENIWRVGIDTDTGEPQGTPEPVTTVGGVRTLHPAFASSTGTLAYAEATARRNLYRIPFDASAGVTTGAPELVPGIPPGAMSPDVMSGAERIAFVLPATGDHQQVWVSALDGGGAIAITDPGAHAHAPRLSPDGRRVAYLSDQSGSLQLWTAPASGGLARRHTELTTRKISQPTWSRDGDGIGMSVGAAMRPSYTLLFDADQAAEQQVAETLLSTPSDATFEPHSWSSDGTRIAGSIRRGDGRLSGIAVFRVGEEDYRPITDFGMHPVWLRDGRRLLFQWGTSLLLVDSDSAERRVVFSSVPDGLGEVFSVSSDDRWIYASLERKEADVWLLNR